MKVLQILPALDGGGVERGTIDFAGELVQRGHQSLVMSSGGRLVTQLQQQGSEHINFAVHKKSLTSLLKVRALRQLLLQLEPDIIHVRSRVPAWMTWLALRKIPKARRPALVSTFHGLYSINFYSAIMGRSDRVIAISNCVYEYIVHNYPQVPRNAITIIPRGVDTEQFNPARRGDQAWQQQLFADYPAMVEKPLLLMPGRLSRWKGQLQFIEMIDQLVQRGTVCHGVIVGGPTPGKEEYQQQLVDEVARRRLSDHISFLGQRSDIAQLYGLSSIVFNLSQHAEPFGRTVIEALAMGIPVVSYDYGGPAESLQACFPQGLVPLGNQAALLDTTCGLLHNKPPIKLAASYTLQEQANATLEVYHKALNDSH